MANYSLTGRCFLPKGHVSQTESCQDLEILMVPDVVHNDIGRSPFGSTQLLPVVDMEIYSSGAPLSLAIRHLCLWTYSMKFTEY